VGKNEILAHFAHVWQGNELAREKWRVTRKCDESPGIPRDGGYTRGCGEKEGRNGDTVSRTLLGIYRIRYYLSSEKLRAVD
jgi:hypothetical protein